MLNKEFVGEAGDPDKDETGDPSDGRLFFSRGTRVIVATTVLSSTRGITLLFIEQKIEEDLLAKPGTKIIACSK